MFEALVNYAQKNPEECIILGLFLLSELLGSLPRFKSNGVFQLLITLLRGMLSKTSFGALVPGDPNTITTETVTTNVPVVETRILSKETLVVSKPLLDSDIKEDPVDTKDLKDN